MKEFSRRLEAMSDCAQDRTHSHRSAETETIDRERIGMVLLVSFGALLHRSHTMAQFVCQEDKGDTGIILCQGNQRRMNKIYGITLRYRAAVILTRVKMRPESGNAHWRRYKASSRLFPETSHNA